MSRVAQCNGMADGRWFHGLTPWDAGGRSREGCIAAIREFIDQHMTVRGDEPLENPQIPAGYTYFAQLLDHDLTVDLPALPRHAPLRAIPDGRAPGLRLDSVYGRGPREQPYLYDTARSDRRGFAGYFLIGSGDNRGEPDLVRNRLGRALIGDMRNDCNLVLSQLHLAVLRLHNRVLETIVGSPAPASEAQFREAQRLVQWFYQYVVWNDLVRRLVGAEVHERVLAREGGSFDFRPCVPRSMAFPAVPLEFRLAASRTWLAMTRPGYRINSSLDHADVERPPVAPVGSGLFDLRGFRRLPSNSTVQWDLFVEFPESADCPQPSRRFSLQIPTAGHVLAHQWEPAASQILSTILAGYDQNLAAGSAVARAMGQRPIPVRPESPEDSLWVYLLAESEHRGGRRLGPVGSEIYAGAVGGLLFADAFGYVRCDPGWTPGREPALGCRQPVDGTDWGLADLIRASGVPVTARDVDCLLMATAFSRADRA